MRGNNCLIDKLIVAADVLNPVECIKCISPRPVLIIHRKGDPMVAIEHAYMLERNALEPKTFILADGLMHSDDDSFFFSSSRKEGAIAQTDNWIKSLCARLRR